MRPWLPWLAFGVVLGALLPAAFAVWLPGTPIWWWWLGGAPLALIAVGCARILRWEWCARLTLALSAALAGAALAGPVAPQLPNDVTRLIEVTGTVTGVSWRGVTQGVRLEPMRVLAPIGWPMPTRLFVRAPGALGLQPGDGVAVRGVWSASDRGEQIDHALVELTCPREQGPRGWAWRAVGGLGAQRELAEALLVGMGDPPDKPAFRQSGLLHILAVSGMHLAIAAALGAWLLTVLGVGWTARQIALGVLVIGYAWLTGWSPATERALVMTLVVLAMALGAREPHRLAAVSLAALVLVVWQPALAADIGFQLSLVAVLGLVTLGRDFLALRARWLPLQPWPLDRSSWRALLWSGRALSDGLLIGVAASLATAPVLAWHFGTANPWGSLATILAAIPGTIALWLGLPLLVLGGFVPAGPWEGLYRLVEWNLAALAQIAAWSAQWPGAQLTVAAPSTLSAVLWPLLFLPLKDGWALLARAGVLIGLLLLWSA